MTKSFSLVRSVALLSVAAALSDCGSSPAASGLDGTNATASGGATGTVGQGSTSTTIPMPTAGTGTAQSSGGITGTGQGGTVATGQGGSESLGGTTSNPEGGTESGQGGESVVEGQGGGTETSTGGNNGRDIGTGGVGGSMDVGTGGVGGSRDITGGEGGSRDITGGEGGSRDITGGQGGSQDITGGTGGSGDIPPPPPPPPPPPDGGCIPSWFAGKVNVLVLGDAKFTGADTRGGVWVKGDLTATVGYDVGANLTQDCTRYDLVVGGDVSVGGWVVLKNGSAAYGGSWTAQGLQGPCGAFPNPTDMPDFAKIEADVRSYSFALSQYPSNPGNTVSIPAWSVDGAQAQLTGTQPYVDPNTKKNIYVFNTDICNFNATTINVQPVGSTVIINSTCENITFSGGEVSMNGMPKCSDQGGTEGACNNILYNFPNATSINVSGTTVQGSMLAPDAKLTGGGGAFAGSLVIGSIDTSIEFHTYFFEGCIQLPELGNSGDAG